MYVCMFEWLQSALKVINLKSCWTGWENRITHSFDNLMYSTIYEELKTLFCFYKQYTREDEDVR